MNAARNAADYGKVAVLMGGWSAEREVSLKSGRAVLAALLENGVDAHGIDAGRDILSVLPVGRFDRVFIIMHGRGGEDGAMQGALEVLDLPYTGSGVMASAVCMDKLMTKRLWQGVGLPTPRHEVLRADSDFAAIIERLGLPLIVKPALEGSSIGMSRVDRAEDLEPAYRAAREYGEQVFVEQWITGGEYTAAILNGEALPLIRLETPNAFYDYEAKYVADSTRYHCPCGLSADEEVAMQELAMQAFHAVGAHGWGRVDFMRDADGQPWLIEVNTVPGMTDHSLVPMAAREAGIDFNELVMRILATSLERG
ncbi:MAG TPA: D-alanine--D-alanine ligase [Thioalkalivibrio sp.]|nr:D-alanine--D-alanine ligase [Thioalkalivibrio sp.]